MCFLCFFFLLCFPLDLGKMLVHSICARPFETCRDLKSQGVAKASILFGHTDIERRSRGIPCIEHGIIYSQFFLHSQYNSFLFLSDQYVLSSLQNFKQMCEELERMHPRVYMNISRHLSRAPFGELEG